MKYKLILLFFLLLPALGFCQPGSNSQKQTVAVLDVVDEAGNVDRGIKQVLRGKFAEIVSHIPGYESYNRDYLDKVMKEQGFQYSGTVSDETRTKLGSFTGVSYILVIQVSYMGNEHDHLVITATKINVENGKEETSTEYGKVGELDVILNKVAHTLFGVQLSDSGVYHGSGNVGFQYGQGQDQTFTVGGISFKMVYVQGGSFTMGCTSEQSTCEDDEKPAHRVTLSDYYIGETEVTVEQFAAFVDATGYKTDAENGGGSYMWNGSSWVLKEGVSWLCDANGNYRSNSEYRHPVIHVSWNDAMAYCRWLSQKTGKTFTLPTEAQWEFAARGGNKSSGYEYSGSNNIGSVAIYWNNYGQSNLNTATVKSRNANELGLYDMSGNVLEWCSDWYGSSYYSSSPSSNPAGPSTGSYRVLRGGSWNGDASSCRVSYRHYLDPASAPATTASGLFCFLSLPRRGGRQESRRHCGAQLTGVATFRQPAARKTIKESGSHPDGIFCVGNGSMFDLSGWRNMKI